MRDYAELVNDVETTSTFVSDPYIKALLRRAADAIEELQAAVPRWISVEERLPELNQDVFVYAAGQIDGFYGDSVIAICKRCIFKPFPSSEGFENWSSPWQYFHTDYIITHWTPLPAPPKEDAE